MARPLPIDVADPGRDFLPFRSLIHHFLVMAERHSLHRLNRLRFLGGFLGSLLTGLRLHRLHRLHRPFRFLGSLLGLHRLHRPFLICSAGMG